MPDYRGNCRIKGTVKVYPKTGYEGPEVEYRYSSALSLTLGARWGFVGQRHAPVALPPGKTQYPLYRRLVGPPGRSGWVLKISPPPPGFDPRIVHPVAQ